MTKQEKLIYGKHPSYMSQMGLGLDKIEKKIVKNRAVKSVIKVRDKLNNLFNPKTKGFKMDIKHHTIKKPKWSSAERWFIRHSA
ncbi:MAG: hypothetical protein KAJ49_06030 [Arcobacteraceae bacterium]|nr:hypothetical protein [Arcobacteraceae bacterium]